tara:strand:- start:259 stop:780 length:522 start_codon:yes stop_codon:yes gene_type:complete
MGRDDEYLFSSNQPNQAKPSFRYEAKIYLNIRSKKPKPWWLIAGIFFLIVIPFSILFTTDDIFNIGGMCFISSLIGIGFIILSIRQYSAWGELIKSARETLVEKSKIPFPPLPIWPQVATLISLIAGFILGDLEGLFALIGFSFSLFFSLILGFYDYQRNKAYDRLIYDLSRK